MIYRWLPHPILTPVLTGIWLLLNNSVAPGHLALGLLLGWALPFFTLRFWPDAVRIHRPMMLLKFTGILLFDILVANVVVALRILGRPERLRPAFVALPLDLKTDLAIGLLANTICLTPGTVSAQLSADRRTLWVHALDTTDPVELVATIKQRYEVPLKEIFESC
ncbi:MAG: Na+/H+ antiporter subunit E [Thiotrichales bacterium]